MNGSSYLTRAELAKRLGVSVRSVERWHAIDQAPAYVRAGPRRVIYPLAAVEAWEAARLHRHRAAELANDAERAA
jgi:predicted DNA-binding transcriptional regulator AlpA